MKRIVAALALSTIALSASALTIEPWEHQESVALGDTTVIPIRMRILDDNLEPVAGIAYAFIVDTSCGIFPNGNSGSNGITDANGFAHSEPMTARGLTPSCEVLFGANFVTGTVKTYTFVFDPEEVVLTATPAAVEWFVNRQFVMSVQATVNGVPVFASPLTAAATTAPNGATASIAPIVQNLFSGGSRLELFTNDRQGHYEIVATYRSKSVVIPVEQRKRL